MAEVYEGEHVDHQMARRVAIKVLRAEHCTVPELVNRFVNEARALGRINHPGVVHIYDVAYLADHRVCLIMEFLDGRTLEAWRLERGRLTVEEALPLMIQLTDTLAAAHDQTIIHRDIKPENIFILADPIMGVRTKVLDFGIAKLQSNAGSVRTRTQTTLGTAVYMPPEQFRSSRDVDHRSDIYALGCVFFELLAGRPPFIANTLVDHMRMHAFEPPPLLGSLVPSVPEAIDVVVAGMLVKDTNGRYASMRQLQQDLQAVQQGARPTGPRPVAQPASGPPLSGHTGGDPSGPPLHPGSAGHPGPSYGQPEPASGQAAAVPAHGAGGVTSPGSAAGPSSAEQRGLIIAIVVIVVVVALVALVLTLG